MHETPKQTAVRAQWTRVDVKNVSRCAADEVARESSFVYAAEDARQLPQQTDAAHLGSALHHGQRQCLKDLRIGRFRSNRIRIESGVTIRIRIEPRIESAVYTA